MTEDEVIDRAVAHYQDQGYDLLYRTQRPQNAKDLRRHPGADAILLNRENRCFVFIEAKGSAPRPETRSAGFANCLGTIIKRIWRTGGGRSLEALRNFRGDTTGAKQTTRQLVLQDGVFANSEYVVALPNEYRQTVEDFVDVGVLAMIRVSFLWVEDLSEAGGGDVRSPNHS